MPKLLLVDDDPDFLDLLEHELVQAGFECVRAGDGSGALARAREEEPHAVVLDLHLPDLNGKEVMTRLRTAQPDLPVVILTAEDTVEEVVECMRLGAIDYVQKPLDRTRLLTAVRNAERHGRLERRVSTLASELRRGHGFASLIGESAAMNDAVALLRRAAESDVTVLIEGESGTGKEVAARALHAEGPRRDAPFVAVNLGAIPEGLLESALFGHERGAFTGATSSHAGYFEAAEGGTIFLDEVGELRVDLQVRLLRVLQERTVQRIGSTRDRDVDVRVIAATHRDLKAAVANGDFREDLYYRLAVFPVRMPPVRERGEDVMLLVREILRRFAERHGRSFEGLTPEADLVVRRYPWPGNVREIENAVERAVILEDGDRLSLGSLPDPVVSCLDPDAALAAVPAAEPAAGPATPGGADGIRPFEDREREILLDALERCGWSAPQAARRLEIGRATIYRKIERYGLRNPAKS